MILNCNGINGPSKQTAFHATLDIHKPYIALRCESKLYTSICTYEFFPKNYTDIRKDHNVNGGGCFVAMTDGTISYGIPDLDTDCEMILAGLHFSMKAIIYEHKLCKSK